MVVTAPAPSRTLVIFHSAVISGAARNLEAPVRWLGSSGEVVVALPGPGSVADLYRPLARVHIAPYSPLSVPSGPVGAAREAGSMIGDVHHLAGLIAREDSELVIVATTMLPSALAAARLRRRPAIVMADELLSAGRTRARRIGGRGVVRLAGLLAGETIACSHAVAGQLGENARVSVVYPPISGAYAGGNGPGWRARNGIPADARLVLAAGSIAPSRGQGVLIDAFARLRSSHPAAHLAIVGKPHPWPADRAYAESLRTQAAPQGDAITFVDFVERMPEAYAAADVVVNPATTHPESFGRVACEALAAGAPVVSTRVGAVEEILHEGTTALLVPPSDPAALAAAIARLLDEPALAAEIAADGARDVLARFDPDRALELFQGAVARVMARG